MASSLIRKIEADFLACAICFEPLHDPIGLPCLHGYCFECLDNWYNTSPDKTQVICPACKVAATVPEGGIRGFPGHFLVKNLQETIDMEKQVRQSPQRTELKVGDTVCVKSTVTRLTCQGSSGISGFGSPHQCYVTQRHRGVGGNKGQPAYPHSSFRGIVQPRPSHSGFGSNIGQPAYPHNRCGVNLGQPAYTHSGFGGNIVTHDSLGKIKVIFGTSCWVDFPECKNWKGELDEMELVETIEPEEQQEPVEICGICKKRAMVYCLDCKVNLCKECCGSHTIFPFMKDHKIATIEDIQSGKVTDEGRLCKLHEEVVRYYCLTDLKQVCPDCVSLKTCPIEHDRVSMKEAATKQASSIKEMVSTCEKMVAKYQNAIKDTENIKKDLTKAQSEAIAALKKVKKDCHNQVDKLVKDHTEKISQVVEDREREIQSMLDELKKSSTEIRTTCDKGSHLAKSESEFEITHKYADMAKSLQHIAKAQSSILGADMGLNEDLYYLKFEAVTPVISSIGELHTLNTMSM